MSAPFQMLDFQTLIAPLGVKFWDVSTGTHVGSGLDVTVYPGAFRLQATRALPNRSGAYVLHHAWGLRDFEFGVRSPRFPETIPPTQRYTIVVKDEDRRFLPVRFEADLPVAGFFKWPRPAQPTPLDPLDGSVPLYPSTLRIAPAGMARLRAELHEALDQVVNGVRVTRPASWTMLQARFNGRLLGRGIADEQGRITLVFAYPPPQDSLGSSGNAPVSPGTSRTPFLDQEWTIQLQAFYQPQPPPEADQEIPKLNDIFAQSPANLFLDQAETEPLTAVNLRYGPRVFLPVDSTTSPPPNPTPLSILFVSPAG